MSTLTVLRQACSSVQSMQSSCEQSQYNKLFAIELDEERDIDNQHWSNCYNWEVSFLYKQADWKIKLRLNQKI